MCHHIPFVCPPLLLQWRVWGHINYQINRFPLLYHLSSGSMPHHVNNQATVLVQKTPSKSVFVIVAMLILWQLLGKVLSKVAVIFFFFLAETSEIYWKHYSSYSNILYWNKHTGTCNIIYIFILSAFTDLDVLISLLCTLWWWFVVKEIYVFVSW